MRPPHLVRKEKSIWPRTNQLEKPADEATRLIALYQTFAVSEEDIQEVLATWSRAVPKLLFEDAALKKVTPSLVRYIGKRRTTVLDAFLTSLAAN